MVNGSQEKEEGLDVVVGDERDSVFKGLLPRFRQIGT